MSIRCYAPSSFFNVAEAKDEKCILYQLFYKITQQNLSTFKTVESWGPNLNLIIGYFSITRLFETYIAFHFKLNTLQNNKVLKQNVKDSSVLSSGVGLFILIL